MKQAPGSGYPTNFIIVVILLRVFVLATGSSIDRYDDQFQALIKAEFDEVDTNRDGFITIEEIVDASYAYNLELNRNIEQGFNRTDLVSHTHGDPDSGRDFDHMDINGDGILRPEEIREYFRKETTEPFNQADKNGDLKLDFAEALPYALSMG